MPTRWELLLRPQNPDRTAPATPTQLHGLACHLLEDAETDHQNQVKPFSINPMLEAPDDARGCAVLTLNWLDDANTPLIPARTSKTVRIGSQFFDVLHVAASEVTYGQLADLDAARRVSFDFRSVTYFSRAGRWIPLPDPELVYRSLARRWNAFSPLPVPDETLASLLGTVLLTSHTIGSAPAHLGQASRTGFLGTAAFALPKTASEELLRAFTALSAYAAAAGTGAQTTHGLGWTVPTLEAVTAPQRKQPKPP